MPPSVERCGLNHEILENTEVLLYWGYTKMWAYIREGYSKWWAYRENIFTKKNSK